MNKRPKNMAHIIKQPYYKFGLDKNLTVILNETYIIVQLDFSNEIYEAFIILIIVRFQKFLFEGKYIYFFLEKRLILNFYSCA